MSFVVIMPTHFEWNVSQVLANLSWGILHQPLLRERPTKVQLPKLHLKYQMDLVAILNQLGKEAGHATAPGSGLRGWVRRKPPAGRSESELDLCPGLFWGLRVVRGFDMHPRTLCPGQGVGQGNEDLLCPRLSIAKNPGWRARGGR